MAGGRDEERVCACLAAALDSSLAPAFLLDIVLQEGLVRLGDRPCKSCRLDSFFFFLAPAALPCFPLLITLNLHLETQICQRNAQVHFGLRYDRQHRR
jgi:hypothetical protein